MSKKDYWICPSILAADCARLGEEVEQVSQAGADRIHVDVMDQHYVPNLTFGPVVVTALKRYGITTPMDVHLMVEPVDELIAAFAEAGASTIVFHPEASRHVDRSLTLIRSYGIDAGLALNPATTPQCLQYVMGKVDRVLLMSVNPGFGGQAFIPAVLEKARRVRDLIDHHQPGARLEIDGGVNAGNIGEIAAYGVDTFVAGSAIFKQPDYARIIQDMRDGLSAP